MIDKKCKLISGDLVKILDENNEIIDYAYLVKDMWEENGMPIVLVKTQRTNRTIEMVVTNAIKKI